MEKVGDKLGQRGEDERGETKNEPGSQTSVGDGGGKVQGRGVTGIKKAQMLK